MSRASPSRWWTGWGRARAPRPGAPGGVEEQGDPIEVVDRLGDSLVPLARRQREEPDVFIANRQLFGDLIDDERFRAAYLSALDSLHARGARATLESLV